MPMLAEFLLLATASGYMLPHPHVPTHQCPPFTPVIRAAQPSAVPETAIPALGKVTTEGKVVTTEGKVVTTEGKVVPTALRVVTTIGIQSLTTVPELEAAMAAAHAAGRLVVVKFYAPWCSACRVIQPKFKRLARAYPEGVDFFEVDFSRCKPLSKHCDITMLPTGIILKQGKLVEHAPIRSSDFKAFKGQLAVHAEDSSAPPALGVSSSFGI